MAETLAHSDPRHIPHLRRLLSRHCHHTYRGQAFIQLDVDHARVRFLFDPLSVLPQLAIEERLEANSQQEECVYNHVVRGTDSNRCGQYEKRD